MFIVMALSSSLSSFRSGMCEILMANTFSQIYIQAVFAVSGRQSLIKPKFKEELYKYITESSGTRVRS